MTAREKREWKERILAKYREVLANEGLPPIPLLWSHRMTRTFGFYIFRDYPENEAVSIKLAERLLDSPNPIIAEKVMLHEVAHYITHIKYNDPVAHGKRFHEINKRLGGVHHGKEYNGLAYEVPVKKTKKIKYSCKHGTSTIKTARFRTAGRFFRKCGCSLSTCKTETVYA